jgi:hypothetical protein
VDVTNPHFVRNLRTYVRAYVEDIAGKFFSRLSTPKNFRDKIYPTILDTVLGFDKHTKNEKPNLSDFVRKIPSTLIHNIHTNFFVLNQIIYNFAKYYFFVVCNHVNKCFCSETNAFKNKKTTDSFFVLFPVE